MTTSPVRVGIVGTDNSHATQVIRLLNIDRLLPHGTVTAVCGEYRAAAALAASGGIDRVVADPCELVGLVDAAIVTDRHGALHAPHALPLIRAGIPVWVDKPFATSTDDAQRMLSAAAVSGAPLTSYSVLRWTPEVTALRTSAQHTPPVELIVRGTADTTSPYGGAFFYGIHLAEIACHLALGTVQLQAVTPLPDAVRVEALLGETRVRLEFLTPVGDHPVPFQVTAGWADRTDSATIVLGADYLLPAIDRFLQMALHGTLPLSGAELLRPVELMERIEQALLAGGRSPGKSGDRHG